MIYHKLIHGNMLNNYDLGETSLEEALKQGYKPLVETPRIDGKNYSLRYEEDDDCIKAIYEELPEEELKEE